MKPIHSLCSCLLSTFIVLPIYAAPDPGEQLAEAAGAYYFAIHQLSAGKRSACGYAFDFDTNSMLRNGEQDILRNLSPKYREELRSPSFQAKVHQESESGVTETMVEINRKFGTQAGCPKLRNLLVNQHNAFLEKWTQAKKNAK